MTRCDTALLVGPAEALTKVDELLCSSAPAYRPDGLLCRSREHHARVREGNLIDDVGFTALWLRSQAAAQALQS